jgi:hypothetical protein
MKRLCINMTTDVITTGRNFWGKDIAIGVC